MTLEEWEIKLRDYTGRFFIDWRWNQAKGKDYPDELPGEADWIDQFLIFMETRE